MLCNQKAGDSYARVLTEDHQPGVAAERERILASGGHVFQDTGRFSQCRGMKHSSSPLFFKDWKDS